MKRLFLILCIVPLFLGCVVNGVNVQKASKADWASIAAGAVLSASVHWVSHAAYLEANGISWHQEGLYEYADDYLSPEDRGWPGRSGMVGQLAVGYIMTYGPWSDRFKNSYLVKGYNAWTAAQIMSSAISDGADFDWMDQAGEDKDWAKPLYGAAALIPLITLDRE